MTTAHKTNSNNMQAETTYNSQFTEFDTSVCSNQKFKFSSDDLSTKLCSFENGSQLLENQDCANSDVLFGMSNTQPKKADSLIGLAISFMASTVGSGWLGLPKLYAIYGILGASFMLFLATINALIGVYIIACLMVKYKSCNFFSDMVQKILGRKAKLLLAGIYMINLFGSQITYLLIGNTFLMNLVQPALARSVGFPMDDSKFQTVTQLSGLAILIVLMIPISFMNDTAIFKKIGAISVFTLLFTVFTVCYQTQDYISHYQPEIVLAKFNDPAALLQNLGGFTFNMYLLDMIFMLKNDMTKVTVKKIMIVTTSPALIMFISFMTVGVLGYISVGDVSLSLDLFLDRPALEGSSDILMTIIKVLMIGIMMIAYLVRFIALKVQVFNIASKQITKKNNLFYVLALLLVPGFIGYVYPSVNSFMNLIGAFCMTSLGFTFPALMAVKEMQIQNVAKWKINAVRFWGLFFSFLGFASTIMIILNMGGVKMD